MDGMWKGRANTDVQGKWDMPFSVSGLLRILGNADTP